MPSLESREQFDSATVVLADQLEVFLSEVLKSIDAVSLSEMSGSTNSAQSERARLVIRCRQMSDRIATIVADIESAATEADCAALRA